MAFNPAFGAVRNAAALRPTSLSMSDEPADKPADKPLFDKEQFLTSLPPLVVKENDDKEKKA